MESLSLHTLANSLPTAQQNAEKELLNNFKAAALSITTLYRSSRKNSQRAYNSGYAAACQDMLNTIQQGLSVDNTNANGSGLGHDAEVGGMTIGRIMDWIEARLEAIKSREEEEDEEEEREKEKERGRTTVPPVSVSNSSKPESKASAPPVEQTYSPRPKDSQSTSLPTPSSPVLHSTARLISTPTSPSPPLPPLTTALRPIQRPNKASRSTAKGEQSYAIPSSSPASSFNFVSENLSSAGSYSEQSPLSIGAGAKRRHAMMMMLDSASPTTDSSSVSHSHSSTGTPNPPVSPAHGGNAANTRRRTRNMRNVQSQNQNINVIQAPPEAMDVEEEGGRERKRVSRRP